MKIVNRPEKESWNELIQRPLFSDSEMENKVKEVLNEIKAKGDTALFKYTEQFDKVHLKNLVVDKEEIDNSEKHIEEDLKAAIKLASQNIEKFHSSQKISNEVVETSPGVRCWQKAMPIEKVGLYVPGGSAPLFSTVLMLGIPAKIAGCKEIVLCTPPGREGNIHPAILYAAKQNGIDKIYKLGGIQAIGAMAYGTPTISKVHKIFGPGNQYVTKAKQLVNYEGTSIDMVAGPSEVLVVADETSDPAFVAADLLAQAEHGADSMVVLVTNDKEIIEAVMRSLKIQLNELDRKEIAWEAIENSLAVILSDEAEMVQFINEYAPEHLIISTKDNHMMADAIMNAGSVFLGNYTPETAGDYASGTNHTLPTNGFARTYGGVNLDSYVKKITFQEISKEGLKNLSGALNVMAEYEGLAAHKLAVNIRFKT